MCRQPYDFSATIYNYNHGTYSFLSFLSLIFSLFLVPGKWLGRCGHRLPNCWAWPFANSLWCPWHPGLQYQKTGPKLNCGQWLLTDDPGTFSHSVEDGIMFLFFFFSCTFHGYVGSILISQIFSLLLSTDMTFTLLYQHSNLVFDNCKLRFLLYCTLLFFAHLWQQWIWPNVCENYCP